MLANVIDRHHVRMGGEAGGSTRLPLETRPGARILGKVLGEHLDRHRPIEERVLGCPHARHTATGQVAGDAVAVGQIDLCWHARTHALTVTRTWSALSQGTHCPQVWTRLLIRWRDPDSNCGLPSPDRESRPS